MPGCATDPRLTVGTSAIFTWLDDRTERVVILALRHDTDGARAFVSWPESVRTLDRSLGKIPAGATVSRPDSWLPLSRLTPLED